MKSCLGRACILVASILFLAPAVVAAAEKKADITVDWGTGNRPPAERPVPPPDPLDPKYTREGLLAALQVMAKQLGVSVRQAEVDTSEYPFLVYGVIEGSCSHHDMRRTLEKMPDYAYGGSTTAIRGGDRTYFVLNMNPPRAPIRARAARQSASA